MTSKLTKITKGPASPKTASRGGFTLIETLVAVLVLMTAIAGPLTIASKGLQATLVAKDQNTAFYLAQDAIEYVRYVRDTNKLKGQAWLSGLDGTANGFSAVDTGLGAGACTSVNGCTVDSIQDSIATCAGTGCAVLRYNSGLNRFEYASGITSIYRRTVSLQVTGSEALVRVTVTWSDQGALVRTVTVNEVIEDWQ